MPPPECQMTQHRIHDENRLLELLLRAKLVGVAALALAAVGGTRRETGLRENEVLVSRREVAPHDDGRM